MMLCTLADVKTMLDIHSDDTSQDDKLTLFIKQESAKIEAYLGYKLAMSDYTDEVHAVNNLQLLQLNALPLRSVTSVKKDGADVSGWKIIKEYARWGRLYRGEGWGGAIYTRGFTYDFVAGVYDYTISYTAGYYLPGDENYVEGAEGSLPYDIVSACMQSVAFRYGIDSNNAIGLKSHTEGGISDTYTDGASSAGLCEGVRELLAKYIFYGIA